MKRRSFVKVSGLTAMSLSMSGFVLIIENGVSKTNCPTSTDILGPFFRPNAPMRNNLIYDESKPGTP